MPVRCPLFSTAARGLTFEYFVLALQRVLKRWYPGRPQVPFVAATGNDGRNGGFFLPARFSSCIAVGAVDSKGQRSAFSTYGTPHAHYVMAPGGVGSAGAATEFPLLDSANHYVGTSVASAYASGVLALLRHDHPTADLMQLAISKCVGASPASICGAGQLQYS